MTKTDTDILCGVVYIPPENSPYAANDPFNEIQTELNNFADKYNSFYLFGDFNARTKQLDDFIFIDEGLMSELGSENIISEYHTDLQNFENSFVKVSRINMDKSFNNYGYRFIDFLQRNNLYILNGRTQGDELGNVTCKGSSTIDYFTCNTEFFKYCNSLKVSDFCDILSDSHNPVSMSLDFCIDVNRAEHTQCDEPKVKLWDSQRQNSFCENLSVDQIKKIENLLNSIQISGSFSQTEADHVVSELCNLFQSNCEKTFGYQTTYVENNLNGNKNQYPKWYGQKCKRARKNFHTAKYMYKLRRTETNRIFLKSKSKEYKNTLRTFFNKSKQESVERLRNIKNSDPRRYWKIINNTSKTKHTTDASLEDLHNFFKKVNYQEEHNANIEINYNEDLNEELNSIITIEEIEKAVKSLKNNKASGIDNILNEHIKYTFTYLKHIYHKLFNLVFDYGTVPESWTIGIIKPIYKNKGEKNNPENYRPITLLSCMGKLFTCVLNNRITKFIEKMTF